VVAQEGHRRVEGVPPALGPELQDTDVVSPVGVGAAYLIHFDMLHRGAARLLEDLGHPWRAMFKFQFFRVEAPAGPSWDHAVRLFRAVQHGVRRGL
jgi:hypothetical protein